MTDLWRLTATEAVTRLRKPELSPLELVEAAGSRMEAVEPKINALPIRFFKWMKASHWRRRKKGASYWKALGMLNKAAFRDDRKNWRRT